MNTQKQAGMSQSDDQARQPKDGQQADTGKDKVVDEKYHGRDLPGAEGQRSAGAEEDTYD